MIFYSKVYSKNKASSEKISWDSDISPDNSVPEHDSVSSDGTEDGKKESEKCAFKISCSLVYRYTTKVI
jgi:hypothetical protein